METQADRSMYQIAAAEKFPYSRQGIRGDGKFCCVSKCGRRWRVLLYPTAEARDAKIEYWFHNSCGPACRSEHFTLDLSL
jgi:hypothetical protein